MLASDYRRMPALSDAMPSVFISHGAPDLPLADVPARHFLAGLGERLGTPRAVIVLSAHWETTETRVQATPAPATVHDFFGFDPVLYTLRYPAPGAPALAAEIVRRLNAAGVRAATDHERGYDHGAWVPLSLLYPRADIPLVQVSISPARPASFHWQLGRVLAPLRNEGVLIVGSGAVTHNLGEFRDQRHDPATLPPPAYAEAFCDWVAARVAAGDEEALIAWRETAPGAERAHPSVEHFLPLFAALGAAGAAWHGERAHHSFTYGVIGMDCYLFDSAASPAGDAALLYPQH